MPSASHSAPPLPFSSPFSHPSEYTDFSHRIRPYMQSPEMRKLEEDMEAAGLDPAVYWPRGLLEWVWNHPGEYEEVRGVARGCIRRW